MPIKHIIPGQRVTQAKLQRAKELRHEMTPAEKVLWQELRVIDPLRLARRDTSPKSDDED